MSSPNLKRNNEVLIIPRLFRRDSAYCRRFTLRQQRYSEDDIKTIELSIKLSNEMSQISEKININLMGEDFYQKTQLSVFLNEPTFCPDNSWMTSMAKKCKMRIITEKASVRSEFFSIPKLTRQDCQSSQKILSNL